MNQPINTPEKIKQGLGHCATYGFCSECPYRHHGWSSKDCKRMLVSDALKYIQQLEAKDAEKAQRIAELERELAAAKLERDAAVADLDNNNQCYICAHVDQWDEEPCFSCLHKDPVNNFTSNFIWRGVCPENTEVQGDG